MGEVGACQSVDWLGSDAYVLAYAGFYCGASLNIAYHMQRQEQAMNSIPQQRGAVSENRSLADLTWLRVGGPAEYFFQPADTDDLSLSRILHIKHG